VASSLSKNIKEKMGDYFKAGGVSGNTTPFTDPTVNDMKQYSSVLRSAQSGSGSTAGGSKIRVKIGNQTGTIDASEFDPSTMTKL
jgi:hypothetical protein